VKILKIRMKISSEDYLGRKERGWVPWKDIKGLPFLSPNTPNSCLGSVGPSYFGNFDV